MPRVVHFEIHCDSPERAAKFYSAIFGWEIQKWEDGDQDYWLVTTGKAGEPGINGGLLKRGEMIASGSPQAYVCTIGVDSFDEYSSRIISAGGTVAMEKTRIPGQGDLGYFKDTEGNVFGIMSGLPV